VAPQHGIYGWNAARIRHEREVEPGIPLERFEGDLRDRCGSFWIVPWSTCSSPASMRTRIWSGERCAGRDRCLKSSRKISLPLIEPQRRAAGSLVRPSRIPGRVPASRWQLPSLPRQPTMCCVASRPPARSLTRAPPHGRQAIVR